ncbi:hypothetical protein EVAR_48854_1 [Eumeta japonica]|uniref:CHK kinase-like domain-containing protein n=1 Tax=Eumeta variegata TaxID=151549 RepID=A0A4C1YCW1_EUMVA|nr:hypothetical protein EVAR_48854_1 [Eumeta japonica]
MGFEFEKAPDNADENLKRICAKFFENLGVEDGKVQEEVVGEKGDNYVAKVTRFILHCEAIETPVRMIVKIAPTDEILRNSMKIAQVFKNEALVYDKLLPKYKEFEDLVCFSEEDRLTSAVCYGVHLDAPHECIALEDLNENGFYLADRLKSLSDEELKLAINDLAKFHALGFVLKERDKTLFDQIKKQLTNTWAYNENDEMFKAFFDIIIRQVQLVLDEDEYNLRNGKPTEVVMLDYQLARISSPTVDLQYLIFNCTDSEARSVAYYDWLDFYYDNFSKHLAYHDLKSSHVYPRNKFDEDLKAYAEISLVSALCTANLLVRDREEVLDFKEGIDVTQIENEMQKMGLSSMKEATVERFKKRVRGVVKDFISYGYI